MKVAIVTGVSKGLGTYIAKGMLASNIHVFGASRSDNPTLNDIAKKQNMNYTFIPTDLTLEEEVQQLIKKIKDELNGKQLEYLYVINNAAMLSPIYRAENISDDSLQSHFQIDVMTPMMLLNSFLKEAMAKGFPLIGVNISSGAAEQPFSGWSPYCSSKASINMYTKTVSLEQNELKTNNKMIAFSPGIMDTSMQEEIRNTSEENFSNVEKFKQFKQNNRLIHPKIVANILVRILNNPQTIHNGK